MIASSFSDSDLVLEHELRITDLLGRDMLALIDRDRQSLTPAGDDLAFPLEILHKMGSQLPYPGCCPLFQADGSDPRRICA